MSIFQYLKDGNTISQREFSSAISYEARKNKHLLDVSFELTPLCNFFCKMCYVHLTPEQAKKQGGIVPAEKWIDLARQLNDLNVFRLALTGGECMLHPQFKEIYSACYDMGFSMIIMTNASLIDKEMVSFFQCRPPASIDISVYGFSKNTYREVCRCEEAYEKVFSAIEMLREANLPIQLKCTLTKDLISDFPKIQQYANERDLNFRYNSTLKANRDCDYDTAIDNEVDYSSLVAYQTEASTLIGKEFKEAPEIEFPPDKKIKKSGLSCSACNSSCHINWKGEMTPCVTFDPVKIDVLSHPVSEAWKKLVNWGKKIPEIIECQTCKYYLRCKHCIALHWGDTGEYGKISPRLCYRIQHGITNPDT